MNFDKFGINFTITFVCFVLIMLLLISNNVSNDSDIPILMISVLCLSIFSYILQKKDPKKNSMITDRFYFICFILGFFLGLGISIAIIFAYDIDYQNAKPVDFISGILLAVGGYWGFYFFTAMAIVSSVLNLRFIRQKFSDADNTWWFPFIAGVTVGFGIMTMINFVRIGIPPLW